MHEAPLPPGIARGGLVGPSLTTLITYLMGACHASYSTARKFPRDVVRVIKNGLRTRSAGDGTGREQSVTGGIDDVPPAMGVALSTVSNLS
jgi:hypothetical protein